MKTLLTLLIATLVSLTISAKESNTFKGYIINKKGQRIEGQIKTKNVTVDQIKITFIEGNTKIVYKAPNLLGYGYEHKGENEFGEDVLTWRHYKSKTAISFAPKVFYSKEVFMEVMEQGEITLYDYYVETPRDIDNPYKRFFYMERAGSDELIEVSKGNYTQVVAMELEDNADLADKVGTVNNRFRHVWKIVRIYNDWIELQNMAPAADYEGEYSEEKPF